MNYKIGDTILFNSCYFGKKLKGTITYVEYETDRKGKKYEVYTVFCKDNRITRVYTSEKELLGRVIQ